MTMQNIMMIHNKRLHHSKSEFTLDVATQNERRKERKKERKERGIE